jgi:lysophospholipase L1-like esterase
VGALLPVALLLTAPLAPPTRAQKQPASAPAGPVLKHGDRVAITGDSITEQRIYSRFIEDYLLTCVPQLELSVVQLGWSGEKADGLAARLENDLLPFKPHVVTTCYGMNDGLYRPYEPEIGARYAAALRDSVQRLKAAGATVVVGSPGAVDTHTFRRPELAPTVYNDNLAHLRDIAREVARTAGMPFADVHQPMIDAMQAAKPVLGDAYHVCGGDGFHPAPNGHLVMAYALLKALRLDGQIGTVAVEMNGRPWKVATSDGHKVLSVADGDIELESTRYPFCFFGDEASPDGTRSILPYVPFNAELNRFMLRVRGLPAAGATVTWGAARKHFTRVQLEAGINLAAEYRDSPFADAFKSVDEAVARKQAFETSMVKEGLTWFRKFRELTDRDAEAEAALTKLRARVLEKHARLQAEVRALIVPVRHRLSLRADE